MTQKSLFVIRSRISIMLDHKRLGKNHYNLLGEYLFISHIHKIVMTIYSNIEKKNSISRITYNIIYCSSLMGKIKMFYEDKYRQKIVLLKVRYIS